MLNNEVMKKILVLVLAVMLLAGCQQQKTVIVNKILNVTEVSSEVFNTAEKSIEEEGFFYLGTGIKAAEVSDEGDVSEGSYDVYPVYLDDEYYGLLVNNAGNVSVVKTDIGNTLGTIISNNGNVYNVNEEGADLILGDRNRKLDDSILNKIELKNISKENFGRERKLLKGSNTVTDFSTGIQYSSKRIIVQFTDGDTEKKIADFEKFCQGKMTASIKSIGSYTFEIEPSSFKKLSLLVEKALELDYVSNAHLDEVKKADSSSGGVKPSDR